MSIDLYASCNRIRGFTILEAIVALTIMGISLVAIFTSMRSASRAVFHRKMEVQALLIAEQKISEKRQSNLGSYDTTTGQQGRFTWKLELKPTEDEALGLIKSQVSWIEKQVLQEVVIESFVKMKTYRN